MMQKEKTDFFSDKQKINESKNGTKSKKITKRIKIN